MKEISLIYKADSENDESDEEMSQDDSQQSLSEDATSEEDSDHKPGDAVHAFPTPPPDPMADANTTANMSLGNGAKKIKLPSVKPNAKSSKSKMATPRPEKTESATNVASAANTAKKPSVISLSVDAILKLNSRSGSSVQAILKYIRSTGHEISDERRFAKLILRSLKSGVVKGDLVQVKRSFKLSSNNKETVKAVEKMKAKKQRLKEKQEQKEAQLMHKEQEKSAKKALKAKKKPSERNTKEPRKKKNLKLAAVAGDAKVAAGVKAQAELEAEPKTAVKKSKSAAKAKKDADEATTKATADKNSSKAKAKTARKSIGTLAQIKVKPKPTAKSIKMVVAGKQMAEPVDSDANILATSPTSFSTPIPSAKQTRKGRKNLV